MGNVQLGEGWVETQKVGKRARELIRTKVTTNVACW